MIVMNLVIALTILATLLVVHSLIGSGFAEFASGFSPAVGGAMLKTAARVRKAVSQTRMVKNKKAREDQNPEGNGESKDE